MLVDCHVHTSRYSRCSRMDPLTACEKAVAAGLDALVFTEHHVIWTEAELAVVRAHCSGLTVLSGVELTLAEGYDVVVLAPEMRAVPGYFLSLDQLAEALSRVRDDSYLFVAHPFRYSTRIGPELEAVLEYVDGMEVNSVNILGSGCVRENGRVRPDTAELYMQTARRFGLTPLYNTDAHQAAAVGAIANRIPGQRVESMAELVAALKRAVVDERQDEVRIENLFRDGCL